MLFNQLNGTARRFFLNTCLGFLAVKRAKRDALLSSRYANVKRELCDLYTQARNVMCEHEKMYF